MVDRTKYRYWRAGCDMEMILAYSESELAEQEEKLRHLEKMAGEVQKRIDTMDVINTYILRNMQNH